MAKRFLLLFFILLLNCGKDVEINTIHITGNTWTVSEYYEGGVRRNDFIAYKFNFIDNEVINCSDFLDIQCPGWTIGGYYSLTTLEGRTILKILLPDLCGLEYIVGEWEVCLLNENKFIIARKNSKIVLSR